MILILKQVLTVMAKIRPLHRPEGKEASQNIIIIIIITTTTKMKYREDIRNLCVSQRT